VTWAEWIAWELEACGYTTIIQAWDFRAGSNFVAEMDRALRNAGRVIAVLSENYWKSDFAPTEWYAVFATDPTGKDGKLVNVRIQEVAVEGLQRASIYIDLVGKNEAEARKALLLKLQDNLPCKPARKPAYPGDKAAPDSQGQGATRSSRVSVPSPPCSQNALTDHAASEMFLKRARVDWSPLEDNCTSRFWAAGTSLIQVFDRGVAKNMFMRGVRDLKIVLPAPNPQFASCVQLALYGKQASLVCDQIDLAEFSYARLSKLFTELGFRELNEVLRPYTGIIYSNITIFDDDAVVAFYDSVGVGDANVTLLFNKTRNRKGYEWAESQFLHMWDASQNFGLLPELKKP
jgi:hypothetical protein